MKEEKKKTLSISGRSDPGGIFLSSGKYGAFASRNSCGEITVSAGERKEIDDIRQKKDDEYDSYLRFLILTALLLLYAMVRYLIFIIQNGWELCYIIGAFVFCIGSYVPLILVVYCFTPIYKDRNAELMCKRNHASEHKVINAYEKLGRIPTLEETKASSYFYPECGCVDIGLSALPGILIGTAIAFIPRFGFILPFITALTIFIFLFLRIAKRKKHILELLELPRLKQPEDGQMELAIAAISALTEICDSGRNTKQ